MSSKFQCDKAAPLLCTCSYDYRYKVFAAVGGAHWLMTATEVIQTRLIPGSNYSVRTGHSNGGGPMTCSRPVLTILVTLRLGDALILV